MTYRVKIKDCEIQFHQAHTALIDSLGGASHLSRSIKYNYWPLLKHNWKIRYDITTVSEDDTWKYLDFPSEKHYIMFLLKWS
jgi:hypothetical protein